MHLDLRTWLASKKHERQVWHGQQHMQMMLAVRKHGQQHMHGKDRHTIDNAVVAVPALEVADVVKLLAPQSTQMASPISSPAIRRGGRLGSCSQYLFQRLSKAK